MSVWTNGVSLRVISNKASPLFPLLFPVLQNTNSSSTENHDDEIIACKYRMQVDIIATLLKRPCLIIIFIDLPQSQSPLYNFRADSAMMRQQYRNVATLPWILDITNKYLTKTSPSLQESDYMHAVILLYSEHTLETRTTLERHR